MLIRNNRRKVPEVTPLRVPMMNRKGMDTAGLLCEWTRGFSAATAVDVDEQPLQHVRAARGSLLNCGSQKFPVRSRGNNCFHVRQILRAAGNQLHDNNNVYWGDWYAVADHCTFEGVRDHEKRIGKGNLIDIDSVEFDDGHPHRDKPSRMSLKRFVTNQELDVFSRARAAAIGVGSKRTDQDMPDPSLLFDLGRCHATRYN
jgi:hypothetical protein